ncbi:MAG: DUF5715 family protein [Streptosporangiaceae bacterium]
MRATGSAPGAAWRDIPGSAARDHRSLRAPRAQAAEEDTTPLPPLRLVPPATRADAVLLPAQLAAYRAAVEDAVLAAGKLGEPSPAAAETLIARRLAGPEFEPVLAWLDRGTVNGSAADASTGSPGGGRADGGSMDLRDCVLAGLRSELDRFQPSARSSAHDLPSLIRVFLLAQIDSAWWGGRAPFVADADVCRSAELVDLSALRAAGRLEFQYRMQPRGLPGRARDWARRKLAPARRPRTAGLRFTQARPAVVGLVNQVAAELAALLPPRTPRLWVTSMVRSVEHQRRLRALGYSAVLPSAHCTGYACDVEMQWFRRFDSDGVLARLLLDRQEAGQLNVIDEGQAWHVCVSPGARAELEAAFAAGQPARGPARQEGR